MTKTYKALFIDWDDTIGDWSSAAYAAQKDLYDKYRLSELCPSFDVWFDLYHNHNNLLWEQYGKSLVTKAYLQRDRFEYPLRQLIGDNSASYPDPDKMGEDFLELTNLYFRLLPDAASVVRRLAEHYPLTIVSNGFVEVQYYKLMHSGLRSCFRHVILSEEAGFQKPDPRIFELALQRNNEERRRLGNEPLTKDNVLMIGDSYGSDIKGAIAAGMDQLWLCWDDTAFADDMRPATYKVRNLKSVLTTLSV